MKYFIIIGILLIGYSIYLDTYWKCDFCKKRAHRKKERSGIEIIHEVSSLIIIFALIAKRMGIQNTH